MSKHATKFVATFIPTAAAVGGLVLTQRSSAALAAGVAGLLLHWLLTLKAENDGELADASYFFGFLLTLIFLAAGLATLGTTSTVQGPGVVLGFLKDLGAGLVLTIVGLMMRQVRTLAQAEHSGAVTTDSLSEAQRELAQAMRVLIRALDSRPEEVAARELHDTRTRAREAAEGLEKNVTVAVEAIDASFRKLDQATTAATTSLMREASRLGDFMVTTVERLQIEVGKTLNALEEQRRDIEGSVRQASTVGEETQRALGQQMQNHVAALASLSAAGASFNELAEQVKREVRALPNPGERLAGLWDDVRAMETTLASSIGGATEQLATLSRRSDELSAALAKLERSTGTAAANVESGGKQLGETLRRELAQMNAVLDQYTRLFEQNVAGLQ